MHSLVTLPLQVMTGLVRSATVLTTEFVLSAGLVSVTPAGGATVTALVSVPAAFGSITPLSVMLTLWPLARLSPLQSPLPGS